MVLFWKKELIFAIWQTLYPKKKVTMKCIKKLTKSHYFIHSISLDSYYLLPLWFSKLKMSSFVPKSSPITDTLFEWFDSDSSMHSVRIPNFESSDFFDPDLEGSIMFFADLMIFFAFFTKSSSLCWTPLAFLKFLVWVSHSLKITETKIFWEYL